MRSPKQQIIEDKPMLAQKAKRQPVAVRLGREWYDCLPSSTSEYGFSVTPSYREERWT